MDHEQFDILTRSLPSGGTRRAALRLLAGTALGGLVARLGLAPDAVAKPKKKRRTDQEAQAPLQIEGRRKKKRKKRERGEKPAPEEECDPLKPVLCGTCERSICVLGDWICVSNGEKDCGGGVCVGDDECCPGQKKCPGYTECFAAEDCCPNAVPPLCEPCEEVVCDGGSLHCRPKPAPVCSPCQQLTCENDEKWVCTPKHQQHCPFPNWVWDATTCRCVCAEDYVDCGVHWDGYRWVGKCSCHLNSDRNYCNEERGICCSHQYGCDF